MTSSSHPTPTSSGSFRIIHANDNIVNPTRQFRHLSKRLSCSGLEHEWHSSLTVWRLLDESLFLSSFISNFTSVGGALVGSDVGFFGFLNDADFSSSLSSGHRHQLHHHHTFLLSASFFSSALFTKNG
jgi:hypothetical protein